MMRVVVTEFVTLDGVFEDPGGVEDFAYGGWAFGYERGLRATVSSSTRYSRRRLSCWGERPTKALPRRGRHAQTNPGLPTS
jgi:hypothetical protein